MTNTSRFRLAGWVLAFLAALSVPYVTSPYMTSIITLALVMGLYALSVNLLAGFGGLVSMGHGGLLGAGAYGVAYMAARTDAGVTEQILVGLGAAILVSALYAVMAMRTSKVYFLMVTLASGMIIWGIAYRSTALGSENGLRGVYRPEAVAAYWQFYFLTLALLGVAVVALWVITRSPFGLSLRGLKESETRLRMLGYNPPLTKFYAFMLSGMFAAVAGVLYAYYHQFVSPSAPQFMTSGVGVLMTIIGGVGTLAGPIVGSFIITYVENIVSVYFARWMTLLGVLFVLTIMFASDGVVGRLSQLWHRVLGARSGAAEDADDAPGESVAAGTGAGSERGPV